MSSTMPPSILLLRALTCFWNYMIFLHCENCHKTGTDNHPLSQSLLWLAATQEPRVGYLLLQQISSEIWWGGTKTPVIDTYCGWAMLWGWGPSGEGTRADHPSALLHLLVTTALNSPQLKAPWFSHAYCAQGSGKHQKVYHPEEQGLITTRPKWCPRWPPSCKKKSIPVETLST